MEAVNTEDLAGRIGRLEEEIERLAEAADRSRRLVLASRSAALAGAGWLVAGMLGVVPLGATGLVFAIAAIIGGVVFAGSSRSTILETEASLQKARDARDAIIDAIDPTTVRPRSHLSLVASRETA